MRLFSVQDCQISFDPRTNTVKFKGILVRPTQLDALEDALQQLRGLINLQTTVRVRVVECDECVSLLLKPFLLWIRDLVHTAAAMHIQVGSEEQELLPWHETIIDRIEHFNRRKIPIQHEALPID